jgi:hypothetical protein
MEQLERRKDFLKNAKGKVYKHFKGNYYLVIDFAEHTETGEDLVIYKALYDDCKVYARPLDMFLEECNNKQYTQYNQKYRFERKSLINEVK